MNRNDQNHTDGKYGHGAEKPKQIPSKGWKNIGKRVIDQIKADHLPLVSAGVAFYIFLAIFPAIAALISIYGLMMEPQQVQQQMSQVTAFLPEQAHQLISQSLQNMASQSGQALGWGVTISVLLSLWSSNKGTKALFKGINIAYDEDNTRNFFKENGITLLFTFGAIILAIICMTLIVGFPTMVGNLGLPSAVQTLISIGRWLVLGAIIIFWIALIYKIAPVRDNPQFRWVSWGAVIATFMWLVGSWAFSFYVSNFGSYNKTYGSVAAIVILMLWFFLSAFVILLGAEINSEMEQQTRKDTTVGESQPMGEREAYHADHVSG